ncbi:MAG TPA: peptide deformylase [Vicinamibacterales bacterium]|nr:peptide deformylase [Vicinamibacterales bacterium]
MAILKVARMGHPVLRTRAQAVDRRDLKSPRIQRLIDDMIETMHEYRGVGLAAPQVHEELRIFLAVVEDGDEKETLLRPTVVVNPELTMSGETVEDWEGCLSIPDIRGKVSRPKETHLRGLDRHGAPLELRLRDYPARVVQHEYDHLDGILFFDRMRSFETLTFLDEYGKFWSRDRDD